MGLPLLLHKHFAGVVAGGIGDEAEASTGVADERGVLPCDALKEVSQLVSLWQLPHLVGALDEELQAGEGVPPCGEQHLVGWLLGVQPR